SGHFFARSGHSFVVETPLHPAIEAAPVGFLLAHASWSGAHAVVRLERITVEPGPGSAELAGALTAAVVKSAYDAGVYRLVANVAAADRVARDALEATLFESEPRVSYVRQLGSGALDGAGPQATKPVGGGRGEHDRS